MDRRRFLAGAVGGTALLALEPSALAARLGGTRLAFVTADLESHVAVVDLTDASVAARIRTKPGPRSIESMQGSIAVVAHTEQGLVTLIDVVRRRIWGEVDGLAQPRYTAVHPRLHIAYVTDSQSEEVVVVGVPEVRVLSRVRVPGPARHITISSDGRRIWTALGSKAERIAVLDASDPKRPRVARIFRPPFRAHDVVYAPDGRTVWVTSGDKQRIALYRDGRLSAQVAADAPPQHVAFARGAAFVASGDDGTLRHHRVDGNFIRSAKVPIGSYNVTFGWARVVTPSLGRGTVAVLDRNGRLLAERTIARAAHDACIVLGA